MNLSMKWLSDYTKIETTPKEFSDKMTMSGSKVEGYEIEGEEIKNVVVGKILSIEPHPDADKLVVCMVDVGAQAPLQICTGATNLKVNDYVPVALDGSTLPGGKKIKKGKLRGMESNGMLCSLSELNLTVHDFPNGIEDGIYVLENEAPLGQDIRETLGLNDVSVEFEITSNRPDCLSVIGLAREAAATYGTELTLHEPQVKESGDDIHNYLSVTVENPELCPHYIARVVKNIKIEPSPRWMRERLRASGVRPINNIVDITNYVMLEYGQPMHAFDLKYMKGGKIIVRNAKEGESIMTLDGEQRALSPEMLVIADEEKPSAVAGVMGGEYSGIMDDTNTIVFESACFHGPSVRRTAQKLGMRTESSGRFEKGLDHNMTLPAVQRACELVELLGAGEVVSGIIDVNNAKKEPVVLKLETEWINRFLDINLTRDEMVNILEKIDFTVDKEDMIHVPSFRSDIEHKADIAEEIARFYGYNKIPVTSIRGAAQGHLTPAQKFERKVNQTMVALGCYEIMSYSFISPKYYDKIAMPKDDKRRNSVTIRNPLGEDTSIMRTTMIPSMLETLSKNYNNRNAAAKLYEVGNIYLPQGEGTLPVEEPTLAIGLYGDDVDFFTLKGMVEQLLTACGVDNANYTAQKENPTFHPGRCADVSVGEDALGVLGEIHPSVLENYSIGTRAYVAVLDVPAMMEHANTEKQYTPLPKYPATSRDLALLCDEDLPVGEIEKTIRGAVKNHLENVKLFDVSRGAQVEDGKKSVAYTITMRSSDSTLTDEEADGAVKKILKALEKIGVTLRV